MTSDIELIPVIDLLGGEVVRAVRGERKSYRPIRSALCDSSEPVAVARGLRGYCATDRLYVADLDALTSGHAQLASLRALLDALPDLELWLDGGFADLDQAGALLAQLAPHAGRVVPVFGSESLRSRETLRRLAAGDAAGVLSLDRRGGEKLDPAGCWDAAALWPARVIVMTLERVGSGAGPDLETMTEVRRRRAPAATLIGAGGIRSDDDLVRAGAAGADAWLVASALHDLRLSPRGR